jgi:hypothetical protein
MMNCTPFTFVRDRRRLAQFVVLSVSGLCASCYLPLTQRYYIPYAEGATVMSTTCVAGPPYAANWTGEGFRLLASIERSSLLVQINPYRSTDIEFDPTLIRVEAEGQTLSLTSIKYFVDGTSAAPALDATGAIRVHTRYLTIKLPLGPATPPNVVSHLPPVTVDGKISNLPEVTFRFEKKTHFHWIIVNC